MAANVHLVQYTLNNGEVSYRFESRPDHPKYQASLYKCENFYPLTVGGVKYRNGSRWVATLTGIARSIRFVFNKLEAYVLVFGDLTLDIYTPDGTVVGTTITTVWPNTVLSNLYVFQSADVMYICSGDYPVYKLSRLSATSFQLDLVVFYAPGTVVDEPTGEDLQTGTTLTPAATTGNGITFTLSNSVAVPADVGRIVVSGTGRGVITAQGGTTYTVDIISAFASTSAIASTDWRLTGPPDGTANPTKIKKGRRVIIDFTAVSAIRAIDVGKYIAIYGGFVRITKINSTTQIEATIVSDLKEVAPNVNPDPTGDWTVWRPAWTAQYGYPTCGTFFQGRMFLCRELIIWGSITNDIENFALGSGDDDGINRPISDDEVNDIRWVVGTNRLYFGTIGGSYTAVPSSEGGPLTPNDFNVQHVSTEGSERIKPVRAHGQTLVVQFGARKLRELVFDFVESRTKSPNMIALADHITENAKLIGIDFQQDPDSLVWLPLDTGEIAVFAYNRDEELAAWCRFNTPGGCYYDICAVPHGANGQDRVFCVVNRNDVWTLEYFDSETDLSHRLWHGFYTDGSITVSGPIAPGFTITGLNHLEGMTVYPIGNGLLYDAAVVSSGQIDVTPQIDADDWEVGLQYPGLIVSLEPIIPTALGDPRTIRGFMNVGARIRQTLGVELGVMVREEEFELTQNINFRKQRHDPFSQLPPQRGKICVTGQGHDGVGRVVLRQNRPFPAEILSLYATVEIGDAAKCETFDEPVPPANCQLVPPPPPQPNCPDDPTVTHVDSGFDSIGTSTGSIDRSTNIAYYDSNGALPDSTVVGGFAKIIQSFDLNDPSVQYNTLGTSRYLDNPFTDRAGRLFCVEVLQLGGFGHQRVVELDPASTTLDTINFDATFDENLAGAEFQTSAAASVCYGVNPSTRFLWIVNKTSLGLVGGYRPEVDFGITGVQPAFRSITLDGSGNVWAWVSTRSGNPANNRLLKISPAGALLEDVSMNGTYAVTVNISIMFDSVTDSLILFGGGTTKQWDIGSQTVINNIATDRQHAMTPRNGPDGGKFWWVQSDRLIEWDLVTWTQAQQVLFSTMVGDFVPPNWSNSVFLPATNCIHLNHGAIGTPTGGVDTVCLPCPT